MKVLLFLGDWYGYDCTHCHITFKLWLWRFEISLQFHTYIKLSWPKVFPMGTMLWQTINKTCLNISISYNLYCLILDNVQLGDAPCAILKASYLLSYRWRSLCHRIQITMMPLLSHTIYSFTCILKYIQSHLLVRVMEFHGLGCCFSCFDILFQLIELDWCLSLLKCPREALQTIHGILIEYNLTYPKWKKQHLDLCRSCNIVFHHDLEKINISLGVQRILTTKVFWLWYPCLILFFCIGIV